MRKAIILAWLGATSLFVGVPAAADSPTSLPPLAPGEVLLETSGLGVVRTPATSATLEATVTVQAATEAEARRMAGEVLDRVAAAARAAGVAAADIERGELAVQRDAYGPMLNAMDMVENMASDFDPTAEIHYASVPATIRLRNASAAPALKRAIDSTAHASATGPTYELADDSAARRAARAEALRRARADAESYAAAANMRIVRVLRITERAGLDLLPLAVTENSAVVSQMEGVHRRGDAQVPTYAVVGVDFALAPR